MCQNLSMCSGVPLGSNELSKGFYDFPATTTSVVIVSPGALWHCISPWLDFFDKLDNTRYLDVIVVLLVNSIHLDTWHFCHKFKSNNFTSWLSHSSSRISCLPTSHCRGLFPLGLWQPVPLKTRLSIPSRVMRWAVSPIPKKPAMGGMAIGIQLRGGKGLVCLTTENQGLQGWTWINLSFKNRAWNWISETSVLTEF